MYSLMYCSMSSFYLAEMKHFKLDSIELVQFNVFFNDQFLLDQDETVQTRQYGKVQINALFNEQFLLG